MSGRTQIFPGRMLNPEQEVGHFAWKQTFRGPSSLLFTMETPSEETKDEAAGMPPSNGPACARVRVLHIH